MDFSFLQTVWEYLTDPTLATLIAGLIGAFAVLASALISKRVLSKQHQVHGLLKAFELLDNNKHRKARKKVYCFYFEYRKYRNIKVFDNPQVEQVMADFDVIGRLVRSKNISKNDFFNVYGSLAYRCWRLLEIHINEERKSRDFDQFMDNFVWLAEKGYKYWKKKKHDIKTT